MPQPHHKRRPRWATLAVAALIATLLATAGPANAAPVTAGDGNKAKQDHPAATTACVGPATADKMFPDVSEGHAFRDAINCLAYYGVTIGYEDGTFKPNDDIARAEMVLFMERAAAIAGADAAKVVGTFATTGSDPVNRADMATLLARLLESATTKGVTPNNVVNSAADGTFTFDPAPAATNPLDYFTDVRGGNYNRVTDSAVSVLYELGVTNGRPNGTFAPADTVSRGAMAAFITRALAHTTARPAGVTIQELGTGGAKISVRSADFRPVGNASLDLVSIATSSVARAFKSDGTCRTSVLADASGGSGGTKCQIDHIDPVTTAGTGDYDQAITVAAGGTTLWAWTGSVGDKIDKDSEGVAMIELTKSAPLGGNHVKVSTSEPAGVELNRFGTTVTVTLQLVSDVTGAKNAAPTAAQRALSHTVQIRLCQATDTDLGVTDDCGVSEAVSITPSSVQFDATGKAEFTVTVSDPDTDDTGDTTQDTGTASYTITLGTQTPALAAATGSSLTGDVSFSDAASTAATIKVSTPVDYAMVPASGTAGNTAVVTVLDQYGNGMAGQGVKLDPTTGTNSTYPTAARTTAADGTVRIGYAHDTDDEAETITAFIDADNDGQNNGGELAGSTTFYWVNSGMASGSGAVLAGDLEKNEVVVQNGSDYELIRYDSNDQYTVTDANASADVDAAGYGMAVFETWLAMDMGITKTLTTETETAQTLTWGGYDATDSDLVTNLTLSGSTT